MHLNPKSIDKLCEIINGDGVPADYRKGYQLVEFFNQLGYSDTYGAGFPSRGEYTKGKLTEINGTDKMETCIRNAFSVIDFIERLDDLDSMIESFNKYLAFDKIKIVRRNEVISFEYLDRIIIDEPTVVEASDDEKAFLSRVFSIDLDCTGLPDDLKTVISGRMKEAEQCAANDAPLAATIMIGSILEGVLLGIANAYPREFNQAAASPKDRETGQVKPFSEWSLSNFIDVAAEIGILAKDVKEYSHTLRNFRNYIHPNEQLRHGFTPGQHTARISLQVLKAAVSEIGDYRKAMDGGNGNG